jgi:hypothetical protein
MDVYGTALVNSRKSSNQKVTLKVADSSINAYGYDIESIDPGDTCTIVNMPDSSTTLDTNMLITSVNYYGDYAILELEELRQTLSNKVTDIDRALRQDEYVDGPTTDFTGVAV